VELLNWTGTPGPDLNPLENRWALLKRATAAKRPLNKRQLVKAVINSWRRIITATDLL